MRLPLLAAGLAAAYLAAALLAPELLLLVVLGAAVGACALVLARRRSWKLSVTLPLLASWLAGGLAGAVLLGDRPVAGLLWVVLALFLLPLPLVPLLYRLTFEAGETDDPEPDP